MKTKITLLFLMINLTLFAQVDVTVTDNVGSGDVYWTTNNTYRLDGGVL